MITETVLVGVIPLPGNRPTRVHISYATGQELVLDGQVLGMWWQELHQMYMLQQRLKMMTNMPTIPSDQIQKEFLDDDLGDDDDDESH